MSLFQALGLMFVGLGAMVAFTFFIDDKGLI